MSEVIKMKNEFVAKQIQNILIKNNLMGFFGFCSADGTGKYSICYSSPEWSTIKIEGDKLFIIKLSAPTTENHDKNLQIPIPEEVKADLDSTLKGIFSCRDQARRILDSIEEVVKIAHLQFKIEDKGTTFVRD